MMTKFGLKEKDTDKILSIGAGGYIRKADKQALHEMWNREPKPEQKSELKEQPRAEQPNEQRGEQRGDRNNRGRRFHRRPNNGERKPKSTSNNE